VSERTEVERLASRILNPRTPEADVPALVERLTELEQANRESEGRS
jgi:hypothetical protein